MTDWNRLPYPLGYKVHLMKEGLVRVQAGESVPEMRFLVCTAMTALLRFSSSIMLADYLRRGAGDHKVNAYIAARLVKPSDTQWLRIVETLANATPVHMAAQKVAAAMIRKSEASSLFERLVAYRNDVAHGKGPDPLAERQMAEGVIKLYVMFAWLGEWDLIVDLGQSHYCCCGNVPARQGVPGNLQADLLEQPVLRHTADPGVPLLSLWPFLHFSPKDCGEGDVLRWDEMFLYNSLDRHRLNLIGYRYPRQVDHIAAGIKAGDQKYREFVRKMKDISLAAPLARDIPDYHELCDFHEQWFVGRENVLQSIENFVGNVTDQYGVLRALPGMGKTALLSHLFHDKELGPEATEAERSVWRQRPVHFVWHFCSGLEGRDDPYVFLRSLVAQIGRLYLQDRQVEEYMDTDLERLIRKYLELLKVVQGDHLSDGRKLVIVIDGLDESLAPRRADFTIPGLIPPVQMLDRKTGKSVSWPLPRNVKVLLSYRVTSAMTQSIAKGLVSSWNDIVEAHLRHLPGPLVSLTGDQPLGGLTEEDVFGPYGIVAKARQAALKRGVVQSEISDSVRSAIWKGAVSPVSV